MPPSLLVNGTWCSKLANINFNEKKRFDEIMKHLHLADNIDIDKEDKFAKGHSILDILNEDFLKYGEVFGPTLISIDESMAPYYGWHPTKQFMRGKPIRWCYTAWMILFLVSDWITTRTFFIFNWISFVFLSLYIGMVSDIDDNYCICKDCGDSNKRIICALCSSWSHLKCANLSGVRQDFIKQVNWICSHCLEGAKLALGICANLKQIENKLVDFLITSF